MNEQLFKKTSNFFYIKAHGIVAFTLAEIMIVLLVIGIVASLVIPGFIYDSQKAEYFTKLKKRLCLFSAGIQAIETGCGWIYFI